MRSPISSKKLRTKSRCNDQLIGPIITHAMINSYDQKKKKKKKEYLALHMTMMKILRIKA